MMRRAAFLDRDGVLNRAFEIDGVSHPPNSAAETEILPGVVEACRMLREAGFLLVLVTNQPDISRGLQTREAVDAINQVLDEVIAFDNIQICPHDNADRCECRKPKPGMLIDAARCLGVDLAASVMVGDRHTDITAGRSAGCRTVFVGLRGGTSEYGADFHAESLREAADWICCFAARAAGAPDV
jgi:D-glycero-D-manno-heptose 1,7-bisphosphate phosphatase